MTFAEIVSAVQDRLNLTSSASTTRIGKLVNIYYKRTTTSIGLAQVSRPVVGTSIACTIGSPLVTFTNMEKVTRVYYLSGTSKKYLDEVTLDQLLEIPLPPTSDNPKLWAPQSYTNDDVVIRMDVNAATGFALKADGFAVAGTLSGSNTPVFPESFHDILIEGVLQDEYKKMEKLQLAQISSNIYEQRLSDLRYWAAKSLYLDIHQGKRSNSLDWIKIPPEAR